MNMNGKFVFILMWLPEEVNGFRPTLNRLGDFVSGPIHLNTSLPIITMAVVNNSFLEALISLTH